MNEVISEPVSSHIDIRLLWTSPFEEHLPVYLVLEVQNQKPPMLLINGCVTVFCLYGLVVNTSDCRSEIFTSVL